MSTLHRSGAGRRPAAAIFRAAALALTVCTFAWGAGFFGSVVAIGGHASDIALDEQRRVLYIANFSAGRIELMDTGSRTIPSSMNVPYPAALSLSPDNKYLVVASYGNFQSPNGQPTRLLTVIDLDTRARKTLALGSSPLAVAFGGDGQALVLTTNEALLLDPASGALRLLGSIPEIAAKALPVVPPDFPPSILTASLGVSGDKQFIYGVTETLTFAYNVAEQNFVTGPYTAEPPLGPRLVSVNQDGSLFLAGWVAFSARYGLFGYQFADVSGDLNTGSHAIDTARGLIYAQIPDAGPPAAPPTTETVCLPSGTCITITTPPPPDAPAPTLATPPNLMVVDANNLAVRQRLLIQENLAGRSILNAAGDTLYAISNSGVTVFPIGSLGSVPRVVAQQEDILFSGAFCDRRTLTRDITIVDPSGASTPFRLSVAEPALASLVSFSATSGVTPATIRVSVDPSAFQNLNGTSAIYVRIESDTAANLQSTGCPKPEDGGSWAAACVRVLVNNSLPGQRGTVVNVPGRLVDVLADTARNRFYIVRQDTNQVLVFDGANNSQIAALNTSNHPTQSAITFDGKYLLVGHNNAQVISVFDLDTLEESAPIRMPPGYYPRSVAVAGHTILVASRVATGDAHKISRADIDARIATPYPTLGVFENRIHEDTVLAASPNGSHVLAAMPDGTVMLYDANQDTFTVARKDFASLAGAYAASNYGRFAVGNKLLNESLGRIAEYESAGGDSGFLFAGDIAFRTTSGGAGQPGVLQRIDLNSPAQPASSVTTIESPLLAGRQTVLGTTGSAFIRSLAALPNGSLISLTDSGFTVISATGDTTGVKPVISSVINTGDQSANVTAGGLISILGSNLATATVSSTAVPAPTALGGTCATVNGTLLPLFLVSPPRINAQLPLITGTSGTLIVYTPTGVSDPFPLTLRPVAPGVIPSPNPSVPGQPEGTIIRVENNLPVTLTNPVHKGDRLQIYASGLGPTNPAVPAGTPAPSDPPAVVITQPVVTLGGVTLPVFFAGLEPGQIGVYRIDVEVPHGVSQGLCIPLVITQGSASSTELCVRVVQ